ncbi:AMP-binding protein [Peteryoungia ipomoeae]|uniref:Acyl-CoA synthetase n=1 Tax=Peteryoungia ipomoeae TaxID=1210932 RepID=A0A4S8NYM9_9HYPH|nr:AMP-binding protein [Peteryoungia ipomoeae]THV20219.1 acyl-CoA synthetase [Peteryoungia ipomoeae]
MILIDGTFHSEAQINERATAFLAATGIVDPRLSVAVCFDETVDWLSAFFAIRQLGASILPLLPGTPLATARKLAKEAGCHRLFHGGTTAEWLGEPDDDSPRGRLLQMSSGTTGAAKCVARGWDDIERELEDYVCFFREPQDMTPVVACPTTHSYGLICGLLVGLKRGRVSHVVNTGNPKHLIRVLRETERPILYSSPAMLHTLARLLPLGEKVHAIMTSGTLLPESWFSTIRAKCERFYQQYGCSEAGCVAINSDLTHPADMGRILPRFSVAETGTADAPVEIVLQGHARIETKDLGYVRADGMLVFVSRLDDTVNVSGLNVYPRDVEDQAIAVDGVTDAVAFRVPDSFAGERVALVYSANRNLPSTELREKLIALLQPHQVPMHLVQVGEVPRQANGKISRREIARRFLAGEFNDQKERAS